MLLSPNVGPSAKTRAPPCHLSAEWEGLVVTLDYTDVVSVLPSRLRGWKDCLGTLSWHGNNAIQQSSRWSIAGRCIFLHKCNEECWKCKFCSCSSMWQLVKKKLPNLFHAGLSLALHSAATENKPAQPRCIAKLGSIRWNLPWQARSRIIKQVIQLSV